MIECLSLDEKNNKNGENMAIFNKTILGAALLSSTVTVAGTMGPVDVFNPSAYVKLGAGGSYSMNANIEASPVYWDASPQGYNGKIGDTALYSAAFGYNYLPWLSGDIEFIYRPSYSYSKFQTSTASGTSNFNGDKTRYFNLLSNSLMANAYLHGGELSDMLNVNVGPTYSIAPFIGGGLGVAFNTVTNFYSLRTTGVYTAIEQDHAITSLAWQLSAGLELMSQSNFNLAAGYRYYNGGNFTSSRFVINSQDYNSPWKGTVQANEFFVTLAYKFN